MLSMASQDKQPLGCICSLCNCGQHNCANFGLSTSKEGEAKIPIQRLVIGKQAAMATEDRNELDANRRHLHSRGARISPEEEQEEVIEGDDEEEEEEQKFEDGEQRRHDVECRCNLGVDEERYLTSKDASCTRFKSTDELKTLDDNENNLMHVLVARPEIASKPRDNIIFEGDMDLKTTFETSYEALAKMRLENWKRYQEVQVNQGASSFQRRINPKPCNNSRPKRSQLAAKTTETPPGYMDGTNRISTTKNLENGFCGHHKHQHQHQKQQKQQQQDVSLAAATTTTGLRGLGDSCCGNREVGGARQANAISKSADATEHVGTHDSDPCCSNSRTPCAITHVQQRDQQRSPAPLTATVCTCAGSCVDYGEFTFGRSVSQQQQQQQHKQQPTHYNHNTKDIDPDLSPIIVYDANMNRLETVGLRRRSRYRPSTSLHTGADGMFGNQQQQNQDQMDRQRRRKRSIDEEEARVEQQQASPRKEVQDTTTRSLQKQMQGGESRFWHLEPNAKTDLALNARNLQDSNQGNILSFSSSNIPVDSKRKLRGNVNMTDHIKEQNIIECNGKKATAALKDGHTYNEQDEFMLKETALEHLRQAQQDETDAVEEIRQCVSREPSNSAPPRQEMPDVGLSDGQDRLRRSCQNQNFELSKNEYPELKVGNSHKTMFVALDSGSGTTANTRPSPRGRRHYTDLFSESPDFILTSG